MARKVKDAKGNEYEDVSADAVAPAPAKQDINRPAPKVSDDAEDKKAKQEGKAAKEEGGKYHDDTSKPDNTAAAFEKIFNVVLAAASNPAKLIFNTLRYSMHAGTLGVSYGLEKAAGLQMDLIKDEWAQRKERKALQKEAKADEKEAKADAKAYKKERDKHVKELFKTNAAENDADLLAEAQAAITTENMNKIDISEHGQAPMMTDMDVSPSAPPMTPTRPAPSMTSTRPVPPPPSNNKGLEGAEQLAMLGADLEKSDVAGCSSSVKFSNANVTPNAVIKKASVKFNQAQDEEQKQEVALEQSGPKMSSP